MKQLINILLLFIALTSSLTAQNTKVMQLVKHVIPLKEYRFQDEFLLEINAEKANIDIKVISGNVVKLRLEQSTTNANVRVAKMELDYCNFIERKERNYLYFSNNIQIPASSNRLSSIVNTKYTIEVPAYCHLKIKNELGTVTINDVKTSTHLNLQYCSLKINNAAGKLYADFQIGDFNLSDSHMQAELLLENINLKLYECGGSFDIQSHFGNISCTLSEQMNLFNATLEYCEATLINRTTLDYNYAITSNNANINVLDDTIKENTKKEERKESLHLKTENSVGTIIIKSNYSDINLY